jgi:TPP-dependent trihydroxycyclohexane-1,2-dione (THcHDO) dehydratase
MGINRYCVYDRSNNSTETPCVFLVCIMLVVDSAVVVCYKGSYDNYLAKLWSMKMKASVQTVYGIACCSKPFRIYL